MPRSPVRDNLSSFVSPEPGGDPGDDGEKALAADQEHDSEQHDSEHRDSKQISRRRFLKALVVSAAAVPFAGSALASAIGAASPTISRAHFPQSLASGDPRPDRVLLWTRAPDANGQNVPLRLQVADDAGFTQLRVERDLVAHAQADHCLRVRVEGLQPGRDYHYRFLRETEQGWVSSPHGRTRTAPAADADAPLRFAFVSCQDFGGRWYNTLLPLLQEDLDFVLHLGDFIYESVGDESFQTQDAARSITFTDQAGALQIGKGGKPYFAARSLDNYRQLHREYRGDPVLQTLLERAPLVAIWDDHEFSDDCWQDHAVYSNGRVNDEDRQRRRNAEQAYFEYMPVDVEVGEVESDGKSDVGVLEVDAQRLFPATKLWRTLEFGRNARLVLLDYRSKRPDHLIPEDAFPGALAYDQDALRTLLPKLGLDFDEMSSKLLPYIDLRDEQWKSLHKPLRRALSKAYVGEGLAPREAKARAQALIAAPMALAVVSSVLERYNQAVPGFMSADIPPKEGDYPRGLPWLMFGKSKLFHHLGSRYFVVKDSYDLLLALREAEGRATSAFGEAQQAWLREQLANGKSTQWTLLASSVSMTSMILDLSDPELQAPALMQRKFYLNVDQWDGFGRERDAWVREFDKIGGAVVLSGDIHAGFATQLSGRSVEFTVPAVSSQTLRDIMAGSAAADPATAEAGKRLVGKLDPLLATGNDRIRYAQSERHGVGVMALTGDGLSVRFLEMPADACRERLYDQPEAAAARRQWTRFDVAKADRRLTRVVAEPATSQPKEATKSEALRQSGKTKESTGRRRRRSR